MAAAAVQVRVAVTAATPALHAWGCHACPAFNLPPLWLAPCLPACPPARLALSAVLISSFCWAPRWAASWR